MNDQSEKITELEQRITELTEQESELSRLCGVMREENWALTAKVKDLEAQIEAVGAGGVQAMKPSDFSIAQLRHLYANLVSGAVKDSAAAKRIAEGLLAPVIERLERVVAQQQDVHQQEVQEPMFWVRLRSDGGYEGPIHHDAIESVRKSCGDWHPLYLESVPKQRGVA